MIEDISHDTTIRMAAGAPTVEKGRAIARQPGPRVLTGGWQDFMDEHEYVPELRWPGSVRAYDIMRTDSQLSALHTAVTMPIRRYKWFIDPNGSDEAVYTGVADDLGLDIVGQEPRPRGRMKGRFSHDKHLYNSFLAGIYGFQYFEQQGTITTRSEGGDGLWHLRKLFPVMPRTINKISVADDGGLESITQHFSRGTSGQPEPIPVTQLVAFIMDQEGPNWVGRSWMRDCYKDYLVKDRLVRVDAINHERAGGIHIAKAPPGASPSDIDALSKMAQQAKVGEEAGGAIPHMAEYDIKNAGRATDVIASIKYHDEAMARRYLAMFLQLGSTETGSRALGQSFVDYMFLMQKTHAKWYIDVMNEHVIEDWVDWNYGEDVQAPLLTYLIEEEDEYLSVNDLAMLVEKNIIQVDEAIEDQIRHRFRLADRTMDRVPVVEETKDPTVLARARAAAAKAYLAVTRARDDE